MQISFLWIGKTKNSAIKSLASDFLARVRRLAPCGIIEVRDISKRSSLSAAGLIAAEGQEISRHIPTGGKIVALDETGTQFASRDFARWLETEQIRGTKAITFVIGGYEGLSSAVTDRSNLTLSLGKMTWTHEMCRVLILEQVYRALCIIRKLPYHRGGD